MDDEPAKTIESLHSSLIHHLQYQKPCLHFIDEKTEASGGLVSKFTSYHVPGCQRRKPASKCTLKHFCQESLNAIFLTGQR